jgi:hypothetical protein
MRLGIHGPWLLEARSLPFAWSSAWFSSRRPWAISRVSSSSSRDTGSPTSCLEMAPVWIACWLRSRVQISDEQCETELGDGTADTPSASWPASSSCWRTTTRRSLVASGSRSQTGRSPKGRSMRHPFRRFALTSSTCSARGEAEGLVVADSRTPALNTSVAHSVFTQKFKLAGDEYEHILEMPTFGHSDNHAGIQIADLLASALLFPMATNAFCLGHVGGVHVHNDFELLRHRFGPRLSRLQYRYLDGARRYRGGITVDDRISHSSGGRLFRPEEVPALVEG